MQGVNSGIIDSPRSLQTACKDAVAYYDILSSIEAFLASTKPTPFRQILGVEALGTRETVRIEMKGLEPLLKEDVETMFVRVEALVRKYTRPSTEVGKARWNNFNAFFMEK